ncbi:hypothetical protein C8F01DRAFT_1117896 [Mycena amicta]|nr:hypothetical protein C8F01DRAFT_1117896 [Mycena amicta]
MSTPIVTGYYRYTDIWFEWPKYLAAEDADAIKAVLAHDSIVHADNPLVLDGSGITLTRGKLLENGEIRLLFTSKQIDYARYWLHAMGLTKEIIPLPSSDCLILQTELESQAPVTYKTGGDLRGAVKQIDKENKRAKHAPSSLAARRSAFEKTRASWAAKNGTWIAVDFEEWERDHTVILEFGYAQVHFASQQEHERTAHYTLQSTAHYRNGLYVKDNRHRYHFGQTTSLANSAALKTTVADLLHAAQERGPVFLVFHDYSQDIKTLKRLEAPIEDIVYDLPVVPPTQGLFAVDTGHLFGALIGDGSANRRGLTQLCNHLKVDAADETTLHNAGNDAQFTLLALRKMVGGEPLDVLREEMWPNQTHASGLAVEFKPWEDDSDYSDQEGV